jgi:hypothetical protein
MKRQGKNRYRGMISSDWNECLAPCGPFDPIAFACPELEEELSGIFRLYTGNLISLSEATRRIGGLLPKPITERQMDAYLDASFITYRGVVDLVKWCKEHHVLFMINTRARLLSKGKCKRHAPSRNRGGCKSNDFLPGAWDGNVRGAGN